MTQSGDCLLHSRWGSTVQDNVASRWESELGWTVAPSDVEGQWTTACKLENNGQWVTQPRRIVTWSHAHLPNAVGPRRLPGCVGLPGGSGMVGPPRTLQRELGDGQDLSQCQGETFMFQLACPSLISAGEATDATDATVAEICQLRIRQEGTLGSRTKNK
jgi:hypothetical protein